MSSSDERMLFDRLEAIRLFASADYAGALRGLRLVAPMAGGDPFMDQDLAHALFHLGKLPLAREHYLAAIHRGLELPESFYNLGRIAESRNEPAAAREMLVRALRLPSRIIEGGYYLGLFFKDDKAFCADCHYRLAIIAQADGSLEQALEHLGRAVQLVPGLAAAHRMLGVINLDLGRPLASASAWERFLTLALLPGERVEGLSALARIHIDEGNHDLAGRHVKQLLAIPAGGETGLELAQAIASRRGVPPEALGLVVGAGNRPAEDEGALPIIELSAGDLHGTGAAVTVVGRSQEMMRVMRHARLAATSDSNILITGERGTGKQLIARAIHFNSSRRDAPFQVVTCKGLGEELLESDLFGHERGAFRGATNHKMGRLRLADGGTVYLDEISGLSTYLQLRLLRFLEGRQVVPLGAQSGDISNVRLIGASTTDPQELLKSGILREDLYYALGVIPISILPLRERQPDVQPLVDHFLRKYARHEGDQRLALSEEELEALVEYPWPGNVRELEAIIERAVVLGTRSGFFLEELGRLRRMKRESLQAPLMSPALSQLPSWKLADIEEAHIARVLENCEGNHRRAAGLLGINPSTLWRKLKKKQ